MDWDTVLNQLNDLPGTFKRTGSTYAQWVNSLTAAQHRMTNAADGIIAQANFSTTSAQWLNFWGMLFGVPRNNNELSSAYQSRINQTLKAYRVTPSAIIAFLQNVWGLSVTLTETVGGFGWTITLASAIPSAELGAVVLGVSQVRPAGVPFGPIYILSGGASLGTVNYFGAYRSTGAYLTNPVTTYNVVIPAGTNNAQSLLPTPFLTDPSLNPGLGN